jgi:hypothetical protein
VPGPHRYRVATVPQPSRGTSNRHAVTPRGNGSRAGPRFRQRVGQRARQAPLSEGIRQIGTWCSFVSRSMSNRHAMTPRQKPGRRGAGITFSGTSERVGAFDDELLRTDMAESGRRPGKRGVARNAARQFVPPAPGETCRHADPVNESRGDSLTALPDHTEHETGRQARRVADEESPGDWLSGRRRSGLRSGLRSDLRSAERSAPGSRPHGTAPPRRRSLAPGAARRTARRGRW